MNCYVFSHIRYVYQLNVQMIPNTAIDAAGNMHDLSRISLVDDQVFLEIFLRSITG